MPSESNPITIDHAVIKNLGLRLKNAAVGGDNVMYGARFVDDAGVTLPADDRISTTDYSLGPRALLPDVENVRVAAGAPEFATGAAVARSVSTAAPAAFSRLMKLRDRMDQYALDLDAFLAENDTLEDINNVTALKLQEHVTFYEIDEEGTGK
ncbi:YggN family protein [Micromonospora radicis]|uniref:Uncharacterized protein n=1 Tax=Micromonospora radicis TaxID=1894971 RepID=A0A418MNW8_9ACTN|nr:hypothetical protein [Micromonospora radicis]RIV33191.1 hypothetical protein D2L64_23915 [Micromonospora radicis]